MHFLDSKIVNFDFPISFRIIVEVPAIEATLMHDNVTKWKHFPRYWVFVKEFTTGFTVALIMTSL